MFQNIKVDIIYYKTNTDFEMEFNLSGCCRMRLLTDKAPDRKILVSQLARAVSRSRIIIMTGSLFGEEGIIKTAATAIGRKITVADNKRFGITTDDEIEIVENAIPLVSTDGIFGGCIIEQGPQTLILLSENKNIRKNIMQTLIHPYIQEVCAAELTEKATEANVCEPEVLEADSQEIVEETIPQEDLSEETENENDFAHAEIILEEREYDFDEGVIIDDATISGEELIMAEEDFYDEDENLADQIIAEDEDYLKETIEFQEDMQEIADDSEDLIFEPEFVDKKDSELETIQYLYMHTDAEDYVTDEEDEEFKPIARSGLNLSIIIIAVVLLVIAAILCYSIFIVPKSEGVAVTQYLKEAFDTLFG